MTVPAPVSAGAAVGTADADTGDDTDADADTDVEADADTDAVGAVVAGARSSCIRNGPTYTPLARAQSNTSCSLMMLFSAIRLSARSSGRVAEPPAAMPRLHASWFPGTYTTAS